jgi:4-azaleucine resistance transporter AzlC
MMHCDHRVHAVYTEKEPSRVEGFIAGIRLGLSPAAPTLLLGFTFGATAHLAGWGSAAPFAFSILAFSGSAQFTLLSALSASTAIAAVTAALLINARYLVMSVALNRSLRGSRLWRALQAQALIDASFAVAHEGHGRFDIPRLVGASVPQWTGWVTGTMLGLLTGPPPELIHTLGLDVAFPAFFLVLAWEELRRSRQAILAALIAAGIAAALLAVTEPGIALLGAGAAAAVGAAPTRRRHSTQGGPA